MSSFIDIDRASKQAGLSDIYSQFLLKMLFWKVIVVCHFDSSSHLREYLLNRLLQIRSVNLKSKLAV